VGGAATAAPRPGQPLQQQPPPQPPQRPPQQQQQQQQQQQPQRRVTFLLRVQNAAVQQAMLSPRCRHNLHSARIPLYVDVALTQEQRDARKRRVAECRRINASGGRWRWVGATTLQELMPNGRWVVVEPAAPLPLLAPSDVAS
jgi:hypothetical protein